MVKICIRAHFGKRAYQGSKCSICSSISGLSIEEISRGMLPFFLVDVGMLMLVTFVPWVTLAFPKLIVG